MQHSHLNGKRRIPRIYFITIICVTIFLYFELMNQIWFISLLGGYLIRVWLPPLALFYFILIKKLKRGENLIKINFPNLMLIFYSIFGFISMLMNESMHNAIKYYLLMIAPVWFFAVLYDFCKTNRDVDLLIKTILKNLQEWEIF